MIRTLDSKLLSLKKDYEQAVKAAITSSVRNGKKWQGQFDSVNKTDEIT